MDRPFLDANVLFSAAYSEETRLRYLWDLGDVELITSDYAIEEARRNISLTRPARLPVLDELISNVTIVLNQPANSSEVVPDLPQKDQPILAAAIAAGATHLLTGDKKHFGNLMGQIFGVYE